MSSNESPDKNSRKAKAPKNPYFLLGIGLSLCTEVAVLGVLGAFLGSLADERWGFKPWGMVAGVLIFLFASFAHIYKVLRDFDRS